VGAEIHSGIAGHVSVSRRGSWSLRRSTVKLAADSVISAISTGRRRPLLLAGLWVGLAFQAKMLEAWLLLPALAGCYLLAAPGGWLQRARRCGAMVLLAVVISLSWMSLVTAWPASSRPYIDGSTGNSAFQQVFIYNGFGRLDQATPDQRLAPACRRTGRSATPYMDVAFILCG
jgi:4-amino-4-deoxy-L-arabinose transferase-like glycosyltransferase